MRRLSGLLLFLTATLLHAQDATVFGTVRDAEGKPIEAANIAVLGEKGVTSSDEKGAFEIHVPANTSITLRLAYPGSVPVDKNLKLAPGERRKVDAEVATTVLDV